MRLEATELKQLIGEDAVLDDRKKNLYGTCPKCNYKEFGISLSENHRFGCFRKKQCGFAGNIFTLLNYLGKSVYEIQPGYEFHATLERKLLIHQQVADLIVDIPNVSMPLGWQQIESHDYLDQRGFTEDDYEKYKPGIATIDPRYKDYIIFPIEQENSGIKAYIARSLKSKEEIEEINAFYKVKGIDKKVLRYINSNSDFSKILLGIDECTEKTKTIILVEGLFDKRNTDNKLGLHTQEEVKCCCTWKCGVSPEQIFLLQQRGIETIILIYDPDVINEIKKAAFELEMYFQVWVGFNKKGSDPGAMLEEEFDDVLSTLQTPSQFDQTKLAVRQLRKK